MDDRELLVRLAVALGLGLFVGLERERTRAGETGFAGVRTFGLVALVGALAGHLQAQGIVPWAVLGVFAAVSGLVVASYVLTAPRGDVGITTEVAAVFTFLLGVLCSAGQLALASALAVVVALVLALRERLHALARRLDANDVQATLKFAIIALIVLPLVPDTSLGPPPFDVVTPYKIWRMIVLISAVDFAGYVLVKFVGPEHGTGLTGLLGGIVSSTALTLGFARRSRSEPGLSTPLAAGIVLAWSVMFVRVLVIVSALVPPLLPHLALGLGIPTLTAFGAAFVLWRRSRAHPTSRVEATSNPFELVQAVKFGLLFGAVLVVVRAVGSNLGATGLYVTGAIAGLTDVDAIALSMAELARGAPDQAAVAARTIEIAVVANTVFKGGLVFVLGAREMRPAIVAVTVALAVASGIGMWIGG